MRNKMVVASEYGQRTITGLITIKSDCKMRNISNDGLSPFDAGWNGKDSRVIPAGTECEYIGKETHTAFYHEIRYWDEFNKVMWACTKLDKNHPCVTIH